MGAPSIRTVAVVGALWLAAGLAWPNAAAQGAAPWLFVVGVCLAVARLALLGRNSTRPQRGANSEASWVRSLALTAIAAILLAASAQLLVAIPRAAWCLPVLALPWLVPQRVTRSAWAAAALVLAVLGAAWVGDLHDARSPENYASLRSGSVLGANPRQSFALEYWPGRTVQVVLDDYVDPREPGVDPASLPPEARPKGDDVAAFAKRVQINLAGAAPILAPLEVPGNAGPHAALAGMRVEVVDAATRAAGEETGANFKGGARELDAQLGHGIVIRSGARGAGRQLIAVCPGRLEGADPVAPRAKCPRKYAAQANAGLGLTHQWPGYSERGGRSSVGFAALAERVGAGELWGPGLSLLAWILVLLGGLVFAVRHVEAAASPAAASPAAASPAPGLRTLGLASGGVLACAALALVVAALANLGAPTIAGQLSGGGWFADAWRWPLGLLLCALVFARRPANHGEPTQASLLARGSPWFVTGLVVAASVLASLWLTHSQGMGAQQISVRSSWLGWLEVFADLVGRAQWLEFESARAVLAGLLLLALAAGLAALGPALARDASGISLAYGLGLVVLSVVAARKPGWFDALLLGAWLSLELELFRHRRERATVGRAGPNPEAGLRGDPEVPASAPAKA